MSIYCVSDIHGCYSKYLEMLKLIDFQETDEMYILGDVIDRGPQSAEMLWYLVERCPANVHCLLGNHEDMMLAAAYDDGINIRMGDTWARNYGYETMQQLVDFHQYRSNWESNILKWIDNLPLYYDIKVNGKRFILVHAGLSSVDTRPEDWTFGGKEIRIEIDGVPCPQNSQNMIWTRNRWILSEYEWPFDVVCGHTPTIGVGWKTLFEEFGFDSIQEKENGIVHFGPGFRKHLIDCGVNRAGGHLGCLRLDDMAEFYVAGDRIDD